jgi:hypothetical protein
MLSRIAARLNDQGKAGRHIVSVIGRNGLEPSSKEGPVRARVSKLTLPSFITRAGDCVGSNASG